MSDYKTCGRRDICPMVKHFANQIGVKLDCSKCKDYVSTEHKCGDCKYFELKDSYCNKKHETRYFHENSAACGYYELEIPTFELPEQQNHDSVNHPSHYTAGGIECIEALKAATTKLTGIEAVCTANAIKYLWRWKDKNGAEDIRKAIWYCKRLLKELGDEK